MDTGPGKSTVMINRKLLTVIIVFLGTLTSFSQRSLSKEDRLKLKAEIDSILQSQVDQDKIPGTVVLIKNNNKVIHSRAYGLAQKYDLNHNLVDPPEKMKVKTLFDIASLTKVTGTTTSVMLLADRGQINIEDRVCKYIKAFDTPDKKDITIRHLLTHTAGLYEWYPLYYLASNRQDCFRIIESLPLIAPVGQQRRYSDLGFVLLGEIIEIVSGLPLEQYMKQNVFQPLGMKNTTFNPLATGGRTGIAATSAGNPYERRMVYDSTLGYKIKEIDPEQWNGWRTYILKGEANDGNAWYANGGVSGAAGLFSTARDLQKLVDMLMNDGMVGSEQFISARTIETFLTKDKFNNGLGWMMNPENSFMKNAPEGSFGHTGFTGTSIAVVPHYKTSIILLINRQNCGLSDEGEYYNVNPIRLQVFNSVMKYLSEKN